MNRVSPEYRRALAAFQKCSQLRDEQFAAQCKADEIRKRTLPDAIRTAQEFASQVPSSEDKHWGGQITALLTHYTQCGYFEDALD